MYNADLNAERSMCIFDGNSGKGVLFCVGHGAPFVNGFQDAPDWSEYTDLDTGDKWVMVKHQYWRKIKRTFEE